MGRGGDKTCLSWGHKWKRVIFQELVFNDETFLSEVCEVIMPDRCSVCGEWRPDDDIEED
jgi:hypothetical protein